MLTSYILYFLGNYNIGPIQSAMAYTLTTDIIISYCLCVYISIYLAGCSPLDKADIVYTCPKDRKKLVVTN